MKDNIIYQRKLFEKLKRLKSTFEDYQLKTLKETLSMNEKYLKTRFLDSKILIFMVVEGRYC